MLHGLYCSLSRDFFFNLIELMKQGQFFFCTGNCDEENSWSGLCRCRQSHLLQAELQHVAWWCQENLWCFTDKNQGALWRGLMQESLRLSLIIKRLIMFVKFFRENWICNFGSARYFDTNITDSALNMTFVFWMKHQGF